MNAISISGASKKRSMSAICYDSRKATRGSVFVAIRGAAMDGNAYIKDAIRKGATTIVTDAEPNISLPGKVTKIVVPEARQALAQLSDYFYDSPSHSMNVIGITGTNGKTTVSYLLESIIKAAGRNTGRIGTVNYTYKGQSFPAPNTTPESLDLQRMLRKMLDAGVDNCVLEVSSHALTQSRVERVNFSTAIYTNLTQDHLDYHSDMEDYFRAKSRLFSEYHPKAAVINADDSFSNRLIVMTEANVYTYGLKPDANINAENLRMYPNGISMTLNTPKGPVPISSKLIGRHNVYNILAAVGAAFAEGIALDRIVEGIESLSNIPGRFETVDMGQKFAVVVDYAHTDDALSNAISAAREITEGSLITVFGCGGDRDQSKRPLMGRVAWAMSDHVVVTSDNPRTEDPKQIIDDILQGVNKSENPEGDFDMIIDRRRAIQKAISIAKPGDMVLIAGKGHEDYQILGTKKTHFDDREVAAMALREQNGKV